ncbi:hypothetical protein O6H91_17G025500 [Diphasiastrum complanatum]|uniref:Uncharacterized protein n=1 Tax=Diphasiastrum complanatum TaxID=34168 RepID=A0ACC2B515_DIPCM|nr:hypothetical protein O6H91_17G025500 [Diphasiastrum complanatum]
MIDLCFAYSDIPFKYIQQSPCSTFTGGGINLWVLGVLVTLKALGNETGGSYAVFEDRVPPGSGPPPHIHTLEDVPWYMLEGELIWLVGGNEFRAKPDRLFICLVLFLTLSKIGSTRLQ